MKSAPGTGALVVSGENQRMPEDRIFSDQLEGWLRSDRPKTLGSLVALSEEKSFAVLFILLMAVPALPLPTGGVTHVFELVAMLLALELIVGRRMVWLPRGWTARELGPAAERRFRETLLRRLRWLERHSRPRGAFLLDHRLSGVGFGAAVLALTLTAFLAPPFTGLDTLPALGVVVLSAGVLLDDALVALAGLVVGAVGLLLVLVLGSVAYRGVSNLF